MSKRSAGEGLLLLVVALASIPWWSWVSLVLWRWFVMPLGAPDATLWHMAGLRAIVTLVTARWVKGEDDAEDNASRISYLVIGPAVALGCGALFHWWMP